MKTIDKLNYIDELLQKTYSDTVDYIVITSNISDILDDLERLEKLENNIDILKIENVNLHLKNNELKKLIYIFKNKYIQFNILKYYNYNDYIKHCNYFGIDENVMTINEFTFVKEMIFNE